MNLYHFEYLDDGRVQVENIRAVDSRDAFTMFRLDHPAAPIANVWVELFATRKG